MTHAWWSLMLLFVAGQFVSVLKRASFTIKSPTSPQVNTLTTFLAHNWLALVVRGFLGLVLFWVFNTNPELLSKLVGTTGLQLDLNIPMSPIAALGEGFASDSILDWLQAHVPLLKGEIPQINGNGGGQSK